MKGTQFMKKILALLLAAMLLVSLAACDNGTENSGNGETTESTGETTTDTTGTGGEETPADMYSFSVAGGDVTPGEKFDPTVLPEPVSTYTIPSCAFSGTDNVYNYGDYEITAYKEGEDEIVYSVYFIEPTVATAEGLSVGDDAAEVKSVYGEPDVDNGNQLIYQKGNTQLIVLTADGMVLSIEYRLVTE